MTLLVAGGCSDGSWTFRTGQDRPGHHRDQSRAASMRAPASVSVGPRARRLPSPAPSVREAASTYLPPADPFPSTLAELELVELHVLHSQITRQLEREYTDPAGPHPVTPDRAQEL